MSAADSLPAIDGCIDLYLAVADAFGAESFDLDDLGRALPPVDRPDGVGPPDRDRERRLLDLLVAYGLLDRTGDGAYRVRCAPDGDASEWESRAAARARELHRRTRRRATVRRRSTDESSGRAPTVAHDGEEFRSVFVDRDTDLESVVAALSPRRDDATESAGVVFRAPGEAANRAQRLADALCEDGATAETPLRGRFEKTHTDLVGEDKDSLEFRLFMREAR